MKIPKGWKKLRKGTVIVKGDKFFNSPKDICFSLWGLGERVGWNSGKPLVYIRKIRRIKPK